MLKVQKPPKKTIDAWEREKHYMVQGKVTASKEVTEDEFLELAQTQGYLGIDHDAREKLLKDNGHTVSRANMLNGDLSAKTPAEDESTEGSEGETE